MGQKSTPRHERSRTTRQADSFPLIFNPSACSWMDGSPPRSTLLSLSRLSKRRLCLGATLDAPYRRARGMRKVADHKAIQCRNHACRAGLSWPRAWVETRVALLLQRAGVARAWEARRAEMGISLSRSLPPSLPPFPPTTPTQACTHPIPIPTHPQEKLPLKQQAAPSSRPS